jgi:signal transduction histidine kinase/CheY-like chemotaxis protein/HAMP domain-containing protein
MVDQLNGFASEVTRVAREVGTEGKLGGQAHVPGVGGTWKDLTDSVNSMASNLTAQVRNIAEVTTAVANGDLTKKITVDVRGEILQLKDTMNTMVDQLRTFSLEVTRVAREVGTDGKLGGQAVVLGVGGTWKDLTDSVNYMASNLTTQVRNIAEVTTAVARGDLTRKITVDVQGEIRQLKDTINTMVDQLNGFASEVTRVAREVGTEGKLGGQAQVPGVGGTWKDLTDSVNSMASNLTTQVRNIATVVTAVAGGDLKRKLVFEAKGEIAELAETINEMSDTLATFADQVTSVAREVGIEGKLGGQAEVPGASGIWRALTDNVNQLAGNLTSQVRAIADVATAVTQGDLTRAVTVEAAGEVAALKDNINQMIRNLSQTTRINTDQDWLKTNVAKFTRMMQGQRDMTALAGRLLSEVAPLVGAEVGVFYIAEPEVEGNRRRPPGPILRRAAGFALGRGSGVSNTVRMGEGLAGQAAQEMTKLVREAPAGYLHATSGLGSADAAHVVAVPVLFEGQVKAVIELGAFRPYSAVNLAFLDQLAEGAGIMLNSIGATMQTEELLGQSQRLTEELQRRQNQLEQANQELGQRAELLAQQTTDLERSRQALHEKAEQVALTSKYKSEFLANMSHELRTPLNSLLILSRTLSQNINENLTGEQVLQLQTIHGAGTDLLELINDILDLSKIESGMMVINPGRVELRDIGSALQRSFRQVAQNKMVAFVVDVDAMVPPLITDQMRLEQILRNLLSNAFKFTAKGTVTFSARVATTGFSPDNMRVEPGGDVIAFQVLDTGIGISPDKQRIIFEAFQQEDGTTSRRHGGTGLGLSISRELARLLGAEIRLESTRGEGSCFTLFLPARYVPNPTVPGPPAPVPESPVPVPRLEVSAADGSAARRTLPRLPDDRDKIQPGDAVALVVEDDPDFAQILMDLARSRHFRVIVAAEADEALMMVATMAPTAVTIDVGLPDRSGWSVLARLKADPQTRHVPVTVISGHEDLRRGLRLGALACLPKPAVQEALESAFDRMRTLPERVRTLLVVHGDDVAREAIVELAAGTDIVISTVSSGEAAMECLLSSAIDCVVLDPRLPDMAGVDLLTQIGLEPSLADLPVVVYAGRDLSPAEKSELLTHAHAVVLKEAASPDQLLHDTAIFLHRRDATTAHPQHQVPAHTRWQDPVIVGRKVLVVDDDVRNIYVMTGLLEQFGMSVLSAEDGRTAISMLQEITDIDVVLMDVMMPEMDGYETMRAIRDIEALRSLPILAVTAKAMKGDRERCIEAGATDYISKPVEPDALSTLLQVWLTR